MKLKKNVRLLIAADGGAGSGKTTASKMIAKKYNLKFLSSGLLYRYVAYKLLEKRKKIKNTFLRKITNNILPKYLKNKKLYNPKVTKYTSQIAKIKKIRNLLKIYQKKFAKNRLCIIEGRDIGTVITPHADLKFFFRCSINTRAKRRHREYRKINKKISLNEVKKAIKMRLNSNFQLLGGRGGGD